MLVQILRLLIMVILALGIGKLVSKLKLPSILGWLITGMVFGPHAFAVMNQETLDAGWYQIVVHVLECAVGLMIGTELVWNKIKRSGKSIVITTLTQSLGTFFCCLVGIRRGILLVGYSGLSGVYFWRNRFGDCAGTGIIDRQRV